jgi:hypothetical protein
MIFHLEDLLVLLEIVLNEAFVLVCCKLGVLTINFYDFMDIFIDCPKWINFIYDTFICS